MAFKHGRTGDLSRDFAEYRPMIWVGFAVLAVAIAFVLSKLWTQAAVHDHAGALGFGVVAMLFGAFKGAMFFRDDKPDAKTSDDPDPSGKDSNAVNAVESILGQLDRAHVIVRNIRCQFGNIDYIVISRAHGVFLIETKPHTGRVAVVDSKIRVNGKLPEEDFVGQAVHKTYWLIEEMEAIAGARPCISSLLVFAEAVVAPARPIKGIAIANKDSLLAKMRELGQPLPAPVWEAREKIVQLLSGAK